MLHVINVSFLFLSLHYLLHRGLQGRVLNVLKHIFHKPFLLHIITSGLVAPFCLLALRLRPLVELMLVATEVPSELHFLQLNHILKLLLQVDP